MDLPGINPFVAVIAKSRLEIGNRCTEVAGMMLAVAAIVSSGPEIKNHCSAIVPASRVARLRKPVVAVLNSPSAAVVAAAKNSPPAE